MTVGIVVPATLNRDLSSTFPCHIHVCCSSNSLAKDLNLVDSFGLNQFMKGPTHTHGHTLDLVLFYGISIYDIEICDVSAEPDFTKNDMFL